MATVGLYRVILGSAVGADFDPAVNDFVFEDTGSVAGNSITAFTTALHAFYNSVPAGGTNAIHDYLCEPYRSSVAQLEVYDITAHLDGSPHGSPVALSTFNMATSSASQNGLPADLSIELQFRSPYGDAVEFGPVDTAIPTSDSAQDAGAPATHSGRTRPRARHRGHILIGPLNVSALGPTLTLPAHVAGTVGLDLTGAGRDLQAAISAVIPGVTQWSQWSRRDAAVRRIRETLCRTTFSTARRRQDLGAFTTTSFA